MEKIALVTWVLTAGGGALLFLKWWTGGGREGRTRFPKALIFGHPTLAALGLLAWIAYVASDDSNGLAVVATLLILGAALLGWLMFFRWLPAKQASAPTAATAGATTGDATTADAEQGLPWLIVAGHGLFAVTTVLLVVLTTIGVGE